MESGVGMPVSESTRAIIRNALAEDIGGGDVTSSPIIPASARLTGEFLAKATGVIAGLGVVEDVFAQMDPGIRFMPLVSEGSRVVPGQVVARVWGEGPSLLIAERVALNFLQRMSGIATMTRQYVDAVAGTPAKILDTRKTVPGLRELDKLAVSLGGGTNHRFGLFDMVLIKDNHIEAAGSISSAVHRVRQGSEKLLIEVEVETLQQLEEALNLDVDRIMLDNMSPETMREAVRRTAGRVELEASGGITLDSIAAVAATGVDLISVGALTHSVRALDVSLEITLAHCGGSAVHSKRTEEEYAEMSDHQLAQAIREAKAKLGDSVAILGHHYQRDEVIQFADYRGDSLDLSRRAASLGKAENIIFCGVYFMAETAAMLCGPEQRVLLPALEALCPMARLANRQAVLEAWDGLTSVWGDDLVPITYQNSIAEVKAFVGEHEGAVCTSSNAQRLFDWAFVRKNHILFVPDEHLGTNTALGMGIPLEQIGVWNPWTDESPSAQDLAHSRVVVWKGYCYVHNGFTVEDVRDARVKYPGALVIVHPESPREVVAVSDSSGSTTGIIRFAEAAPAGSTIVVGTERHLVDRLQTQFQDRLVVPLSPRECRTMAMTRMRHLLWVLDSILEGVPKNVVTVDEETSRWARVALERMLEAS